MQSALASGQQLDANARGFRHTFERGEMLSRKKFGRRHERALAARFDRVEQRRHRNNRLARADIALQQPDHARRRAMSAVISAMAFVCASGA
jgi:hypothetical protein